MTNPSREEQLEAIRGKVIAAVPEIMELKFGCEIEGQYGLQESCSSPFVIIGRTWICKKHKTYHEGCEAEEDGCTGEEAFEVKYGDEEEDGSWGTIREKKSELGGIIGRPIRLFDIKQCLEYNGYEIEDFLDVIKSWKGDDLNIQDEKEVEKIYTLLTNKDH